jgi:hypothetical protein
MTLPFPDFGNLIQVLPSFWRKRHGGIRIIESADIPAVQVTGLHQKLERTWIKLTFDYREI